jgi:selenocysteine lyase/cysteine desulfurase
MPVIEATERKLTRSLLDGLAKFPEIKVFGINNSDDPDFKSRGAVVVFRVQKIPHNLVAQELAEFGGIDVRSGCFCSHLIVKKLMHIHPLRSLAADFAIMLAPKFVSSLLPGIVRISLGLENEASDITKCLQTIQKIVNTPRSWLERMLGSIYNGTPFLPQTATGKLMEDFVIAVAERVYSNNKIIKNQKNVEKD